MRRHPLILWLMRWGINALGILLAETLVPGIDSRDTSSLLMVAVVLGLFNAFLKPLLVFFALPFVIITLGFGLLVINALLLRAAAALVDGFDVTGFFPALLGAIVIGVVNLLFARVVDDGGPAFRLGGPRPGPPRARQPPPRDDDVIDI